MMGDSHDNSVFCPPFASLKMVKKSCDTHVYCLPVPKQRLHAEAYLHTKNFVQYAMYIINTIISWSRPKMSIFTKMSNFVLIS